MTTSSSETVGQTNINTYNRVSELYKQSLLKVLIRFVANLPKYRTLFKDVHTFLGLDHRDTSLRTLYLVVIGISIPNIR